MTNRSGRGIKVVRRGFPEPDEMDTAISHATLRLVAQGRFPETLRLHRPADVVAFGPRDVVAPGFRAAVAAARGQGFGAIERLAGGRAAVFHEGTLAFSWAIPDPSPREGIRRRFEEIAEIMVEAVRSLGVDARIGEVPGEYCPGEHSVNARGKTKLVGVGQRVLSAAAHVGGVVVVSGSDRIRRVLLPMYEALDLGWDPATVGSLEDERGGTTWDEVEGAIIDAFGARYEVEERELTPEVVALARDLVPRHAVASSPTRPG
jgi:octanoyl-[GcvH]:protein N-octanoyltransferase